MRADNQRLSEFITRMDPGQVLFASDWSGWPPHVSPEQQISEYAQSLARLLSLSPERLEQLMLARGQLFGD